MTRILITYLLPLVLPAIAWYVWQYLSPSRSRDPEKKPGWEDAPWDKLGIAGVVLLAVTLGSFAVFTGAEPGNVYEPAHVVDGKVVPGQQVEQSLGTPGTGN